MSVERKIDVIYDIDTMEKVAAKLGYTTVRNATAKLYGSAQSSVCDLVIRGKHGYDIGFNKTAEGKTKIVADFHGGNVNKDLEELVPSYIEEKLSRAGSKFRIRRRQKERGKIRLHVG